MDIKKGCFLTTFFALFFFFFSTSTNAQTIGVPRIDVNYGQDVEEWWAQHPLNPRNPSGIGIGEIESPDPILNVKQDYDSNIQAALNALPSEGGTLYFEPGVYPHNFQIVGKSNIHFIADYENRNSVIIQGGAQTSSSIETPSTIAGCALAVNYSPYNGALYSPSDPRYQEARECANNRSGNYYFKNITFDGNNVAHQAMMFRSVRDLVFDNVTFQNFVDPGNHHAGNVNGNALIDNIWCRGCHFKGKQRYAFYLDGVHGGGVIDSIIEKGYGSGNLLFLTNDDFTLDVNRNGLFEDKEQRVVNHLVVENNTFLSGYNAVHASSKNSLIKGNTVSGLIGHFAHFFIRQATGKPLIYEFYNNKLIGNKTNNIYHFVTVGGPKASCPQPYCSHIGLYTVKDNVIQNAPSFQTLVKEDAVNGIISKPNLIDKNCVNGKWYGTDINCSTDIASQTNPFTNLMLNPSFEDDQNSDNYPDKWWTRPSVSRDTTTFRTGNASMKIVGDSRFPYMYTYITPYYVTLEPGQTYTMSAWVKTSSLLSGNGVQLRYALHVPATLYPSSWEKNASDWKQITKTFVNHPFAQIGRMDINWNLLPGETIWVDDTSLCKGLSPCL